MARPVVTAYTERLYKKLLPLASDDEQHDWALLRYLESIGILIDDVDQWSADGVFPGWHVIMDADTTPPLFLPWLAQTVGVKTDAKLPGETDLAWETRMRNKIKSVAGFARGTPGAMRAAIQAFLTGTKSVTIVERDTSPYHFAVTTKFTETPLADWPTTNFLVKNLGIDPIGVSVGFSTITKTAMGDGWYLLNNPGGSLDTFRMYALEADLVDNAQHTASIEYKNVSGASIFLDLADTVNAAFPVSPATGILTVTGTRVFDSTYRFVDIEMPAGRSLWVRNPQLELGTVATPYVGVAGGVRVAGGTNIRNAIESQKPAGLQYTYAVVPAWTYDNIDAAYATYNAIDAGNTSYDDIDNGP